MVQMQAKMFNYDWVKATASVVSKNIKRAAKKLTVSEQSCWCFQSCWCHFNQDKRAACLDWNDLKQHYQCNILREVKKSRYHLNLFINLAQKSSTSAFINLLVLPVPLSSLTVRWQLHQFGGDSYNAVPCMEDFLMCQVLDGVQGTTI